MADILSTVDLLHAYVERLEAAGADGILVGESLVRALDRATAIRELRGEVG